MFLGGAASATFPDRTDEQLASLPAGDRFSVSWGGAYFLGHSRFLGQVSATMLADRMAASAPISEVRSLAPQQPVGTPNGGNFFPAINRNHMFLKITIPWLGLTFDNQSPLVNEAQITSIPPFGSVYKLISPVRFSRSAGVSNIASSLVRSVEVETCQVKLMELSHIVASVNLISDENGRARFKITMKNESTEDVVGVTWLMWPRPEADDEASQGTLELNRDTRVIEVSLNRDIFFTERALVVSLSRPFQTDGAAIAAFPSLS